MKRRERSWMYERDGGNPKQLNMGFVRGVTEFIAYAKELPSFKENNEKLWCACIKCRNIKFADEYTDITS